MNNSPRRNHGPISTARRASSAVVSGIAADHATALRMANAISTYVGRNANTIEARESLRTLIRAFARIAHVSALALAAQLVHTLVRTRPTLASAIVAAMWGQAYVADRTGSIVRRTGRRAASYLRSLPGRAARSVAHTIGRPIGRAANTMSRGAASVARGARTARMY